MTDRPTERGESVGKGERVEEERDEREEAFRFEPRVALNRASAQHLWTITRAFHRV